MSFMMGLALSTTAYRTGASSVKFTSPCFFAPPSSEDQ